MHPEMAPAVGHDDGVANHNVVFLDTSLDTHLAMIVSDSDTVSDFKRKIMLEHRQLFSAIGDVKVECVKVKRKGSFYHLSDSMLVKSAFSAVKGNWFLSVDASRLEQNDGIQRLGKRKAGDQLALPWVTHSHSVERHDNHGSPSIHSKTAPLMNQQALIVDQLISGGSCKDVSKNVEEDGLSNGKQLDYELKEKMDTVSTDINLKKRARDVHNEGLLNDAFGSGSSVTKKHKTRRRKSDVKAAQENLGLIDDSDNVHNEGASKGIYLSDENKRINEGENCSAIDQEATVVPTIEGVESETVGDVAMVVEMDYNIQQEMSQKDKDSELVQKPAMENEIPSSLIMTPECERGGAEVTATDHKERSIKHKAAEKEVSSTSFIKKLHGTNKDAIESSPQQDVGSNSQECAGDQIDKYKDNSEISLKQKPELRLPQRKKATIGCENIDEVKRRKTKKRFKHPDNLVGDISSMVLASVADERKMNEASEKTLIDAKKVDDVIVEEVDISLEHMEEKSRKNLIDSNDVVTATNEETLLTSSESPMNNDADISTTGKNTSHVNAQGLSDNLEKQNEKMDDTTKKKKKKKTKKSAGRKEDESITRLGKRDTCENAKEGKSLPDNDRKHGDMFLTALASHIDEGKMNEDPEKTLMGAKKGDDVIVKEVEMSLENMEEKSRKELTDANDVVTMTTADNLLFLSDSLMNNVAEISATGKNTSYINAQGMLDISEKQNKKTDDSTKKKKKKKKKTKKSAGRNEEESTPKNANGDVCENANGGDIKLSDEVKEKDAQISYDGLVGKENKNNKSQDLQVELELKKCQSVDHHYLPEKTLNNATSSEVSKVNNEVDIPDIESHELDFKDYFVPGHQMKKIVPVDNRKDMKKTKADSRNDQSKRLVSKTESNIVSADVLKDPNINNIDKFKTPKRTKKIDAQKTTRQSTLSRTRAKTVDDKKVKGLQRHKSLLNAPGTLFGDDSDSYPSTRTPSGKSSSSSSSSGESSFSLHSRRNRNEGAGKDNANSKSESKKPSISDLLRSSSSFKRSKVAVSSRVEDTESQHFDFVPESQP